MKEFPWGDPEFAQALVAILLQRMNGSVVLRAEDFSAVEGMYLDETGYEDGSVRLSVMKEAH